MCRSVLSPPAELSRFFTTFYLAEITVPEGERAVDYLHPEWGNLRFHSGDRLEAENYTGQRISAVDFAVTGPSGHALRFEVGTCRIWGIGLMPLGWAKFMAAPADTLADAVVDGQEHEAFAGFRTLADTVFGAEPDAEGELARISAHFMTMADNPCPMRSGSWRSTLLWSILKCPRWPSWSSGWGSAGGRWSASARGLSASRPSCCFAVSVSCAVFRNICWTRR
jgi:hypothetical protein